jgi:single-stranded-DNA-specific exonuclease
VLNPHRRDCAYPFKALAGAGVALKLAQALARRLLPGEQVPQLEERLLELAALGTVADVMPLVGENRAIVRRGLRCLNAGPSPGLRALLRLARLEPGWIDAEAIAYKVAPRLNAAGRLDDAILAHRLLAARDDAVAEVLAQQIEQLNGARRALTEAALARARGQLAAWPLPLPAALVLDGDYPTGVLGLLAARLTDETGRPVAVIRTGDRLCRGSVRGVDGFDTVAAVEEGRDLLLTFGGHHAAAGLTLPAANLAAFRARFAAAAESALAPLPAPRPALAECRLRPASIDWALCEVLARLEPCGEGNPPPLFESRGWLVRETRVVGDDHLRLRLSADSVRLGAIFFRGSGSGPSPGQTVDLLHRVRRSPWQDAVSIELEVVAWRAREG